jgi:hypothetical protein
MPVLPESELDPYHFILFSTALQGATAMIS